MDTSAALFYLVILLAQVWLAMGIRKGCDDKYNRSTWDCDDLEHYFSPSNLEKTLFCIGYNKMISPKEALNLTDPSMIYVTRTILSFDNVNEFDQSVNFEEELGFYYEHNRLQFEIECANMLFEYDPHLLFKFIPRSFLGRHMHLHDFNFALSLVISKHILTIVLLSSSIGTYFYCSMV